MVKSFYASFDPYMCGRMRPAEQNSYLPPYQPNAPIDSFGIGKVLESNTPVYQEGHIVIGELPVQEYVSLDVSSIQRVRPIENPLGLEDIRAFLGPLGMPGLAAYSSFYEIGKLKKNETIFISAASGAVAKREGLKIIGSVGSDEKLDYIINELGFDGGFNYKREKPRNALSRLAPHGIDIYYENAGGEHLEAALDASNNFGCIVACGMISDFSGIPYPVKNLHHIITKRLTMRGFIVANPELNQAYSMEH